MMVHDHESVMEMRKRGRTYWTRVNGMAANDDGETSSFSCSERFRLNAPKRSEILVEHVRGIGDRDCMQKNHVPSEGHSGGGHGRLAFVLLFLIISFAPKTKQFP